MVKDNTYRKLIQEYNSLKSKKRYLNEEHDKISAKLEVIEEILGDINDILCKHGKHIYEHFEEKDEYNEYKEERENDAIRRLSGLADC